MGISAAIEEDHDPDGGIRVDRLVERAATIEIVGAFSAGQEVPAVATVELIVSTVAPHRITFGPVAAGAVEDVCIVRSEMIDGHRTLLCLGDTCPSSTPIACVVPHPGAITRRVL